jgi:hypothetical protein
LTFLSHNVNIAEIITKNNITEAFGHFTTIDKISAEAAAVK